jgi:hypothetical protein
MPTILLLFLVAFTGCTGTAVKFHTMPEQPHDATRERVVNGSACGFQFLVFIPISLNDRHQRAYAELESAAGNDYVTEIKVNEKWYYALVGTVYCTEMQAMAYPKGAPAAGAATKEEKKQLSPIEECIRACRENTNRTSEQCFDECNH